MNTCKKAEDLAKDIVSETEKFPRNSYYLINLINRAATSIPIKIAEGQKSDQALVRKDNLWSAHDAARYCAELIDVAARQGFIPTDRKFTLNQELADINSDIEDLIRLSPQITEN